MKAKVLNAMWKKAYNRLNRTREWATSSNYSTFPPVHRAATEVDVPSTHVKSANNTSDIRNLGRESQYDVHPLVRESAVARLLVEGRLPQSSAPISIPKQAVRSRQASESQYSDLGYSGSPSSETTTERISMELGTGVTGSSMSFQSRNEAEETSIQQEANIQYLQQALVQEITFLKDVGRVKACTNKIWKCDFCPFTAQTANTLLSHYQFHLQLLTSPSSQAHFEFMTVYRRGKQNGLARNPMHINSDKVIPSTPEGTRVADGQTFLPMNVPHQSTADADALRHLLTIQKQRQLQQQQQLLQQKQQGSAENGTPTSASNFLRCFVQAVMQKSEEKGEQMSSSSIYESLINGSKTETKVESNPDCPAKKAKVDTTKEDICKNSTVLTETLSSLGNDAKKDIWDYPIDMSIGKCSVKQEPMELSVSAECSSYHADISPEGSTSPCFSPSGSFNSDRLSCASPEELAVGGSAPESGVFDMASSHKESDIEQASSVQERKRTFGSTQHSSPRKCNGSFAPRKMLIARSRRTHRSSSMESASSLDSMSQPGSVLSKPINTLGGLQSNDPCSDVEPATTPLPYPVQNTLALDMNTQCSLLLPIDSIAENDSDASRTSSPVQGVANPRKLEGPQHTQCTYCNIQFGDEVLHSIHMGCHNHTEPFVCNMCGKDCGNKYGFYTHIMRGHSS